MYLGKLPPASPYGDAASYLKPYVKPAANALAMGLGRERRMQPQLTPAEETSLWQELGSKALGGLSTVASIIDTPDSMIRNTLAGRSPTEGLFDPEKRASGRDVLEHWGVLGPNTPGLDLGDVAGFAAEIPLSLTSWISAPFKALTGAGKAAKASGLLKDVAQVASNKLGRQVGEVVGRMHVTPQDLLSHMGNLDKQAALEAASAFKTAADKASVSAKDALTQPVGGLLNVGLPLGLGNLLGIRKHGITLGSGGPVAEAIGGAADKVGQAVKYSAPVRAARMLFDPSVSGLYSPEGQKVAEAAYQRFPEAQAAAKLAAGKASDELGKAYDAFQNELGSVFPTTPGPSNVPGISHGVGDVVRAADRKNYGYVTGMGQNEAQVYFRNPITGAEAVVPMQHGDLTLAHQAGSDPAQAMARSMDYRVMDKIVRHGIERPKDGIQEGFDLFAPGVAPSPQLAQQLQDAGQKMFTEKNQLYQNVLDKGGMGEWLNEGDELQHFPRQMKTGNKSIDGGRMLGAKVGAARSDATRTLPAAIENRIAADPAARGPGAAQHILSNYDPYLGIGKASKQDHADELAKWANGLPDTKELFTSTTGEDFLRYQQRTRRVSASLDAIHDLFNQNMGSEGVNLHQAYTRAGMDPASAMNHLSTLTGKSVQQLSQMAVPEEWVKAARSLNEVTNNRQWTTKVGEWVDNVNRIFKSSVTLPFPSFLTRNLETGQIMNVTMGLDGPRDLPAYAKNFARARGLLKTPDKDLIREMESRGVIGQHVGFEDVPLSIGTNPNVVPQSPLNIAQTYRDVSQHVADTPGLVDLVPGGSAWRRGYGTVLGTGGKTNELVEWYNRVPMYLTLKDKGFSPAEAAQRVKELHFDYSDLSPMERGFAKRVMPFYTFARKMGGTLVNELADRPGGATSWMIRGTDRMRDQSHVLPDYLANSTAIPLPSGESGQPRYLTGLGLGYEDPMSFLGGGVRGAMAEALSRTTPLLKAPIEWATGESLFQRGPSGGRELSDLDPTIGRMISNLTGRKDATPLPLGEGLEFLASNSPASRFLTTARTLADPRKGVLAKTTNLLTGAKVTDVPEATYDAMAREYLKDTMRHTPGASTFERVSFSKDNLAKMDPEERQRAMMLQAAMNMLADRAKKRVSAKKMAEAYSTMGVQ